MELPIRPATEEELPQMARAMALAFGGDATDDELPRMREIVEFERTRCAFDGAEMVATLGANSFDLAVPGGTLAAAGTTMVSVRTTHRRRGVLRALMREHLDEVAERGEALATLWASESSIYARFGYGPASEGQRIEIETAHAAFREPVRAPGRCRLVDADEARERVPDLYETLWRERPGHYARSAPWWEHRHFYEPEDQRGGASTSRWLIYEDTDGPSGYARYRTTQVWGSSGLPSNSSVLLALYGRDPAARAALWRQVLDQDLVVKLSAYNQPMDCELLWLLADARRAQRFARDELWVRVLDVKAALEGRRYRSEGSLVFELHDEFRGGAPRTWQLEAGPDGAKCEPTTRTAGLRMRSPELGAVYLGGHGVGALARAGRVDGSPEAIARADALFGWDPAPWCPEIF